MTSPRDTPDSAPARRMDAINAGCPQCRMPAPFLCRTDAYEAMLDSVHPARVQNRENELRDAGLID